MCILYFRQRSRKAFCVTFLTENSTFVAVATISLSSWCLVSWIFPPLCESQLILASVSELLHRKVTQIYLITHRSLMKNHVCRGLSVLSRHPVRVNNLRTTTRLLEYLINSGRLSTVRKNASRVTTKLSCLVLVSLKADELLLKLKLS